MSKLRYALRNQRVRNLETAHVATVLARGSHAFQYNISLLVWAYHRYCLQIVPNWLIYSDSVAVGENTR